MFTQRPIHAIIVLYFLHMQHNGGDLENMTAKLLEKHITDTIREWQVKIGYEGGTMKLYYPAESLRRSLSLDETEDLAKALAAFCKNVQPRLGMLAISAVKDRYCVEIPEEGCSYIEQKIPVPELLQNLLQVITTPGNTMEQVRELLFFLCRENAYYRGRKRIRGA